MNHSRRASALSLLVALSSAAFGCASETNDDSIAEGALTSSNPSGPPVVYTPIEKQFVATRDLPKTTLKVATAPMQCPLGCSSSDIHRFVQQVSQFADVDIVIVTEAFFPGTRAMLTAEMAAVGFPVAIASEHVNLIKQSSGLMIFARKQAHDDWMPAWGRAEMKFSSGCGEDDIAPKGALRTRFSLGRVGGGIPVGVNVFATHLQANPDLQFLCKYRRTQLEQIDQLDTWSEWTLDRMRDSPSILSGDFNFESTGAAYSDDGRTGSEMPEGQRNWREFVSKILTPADMLPAFRAAEPTFAANGAVPLALRSSMLVVRPGDEAYGAAHKKALSAIRATARGPQDAIDGKQGMDDRPGEVVKQFFSGRSVVRHEGKDTGLVAELVPVRYESTAQSQFCRYDSDGDIEVGHLHDPHDGRGPRLVVAVSPDARCDKEMVTLAEKPRANQPDLQPHLVFDHPTRVATYKLVVRNATDDSPVYPSPAAFLHYTGKQVSRADRKVSLTFELTPPPGEEAAFEKADIRARVYEPKDGPWLSVTRIGKTTFVATGEIPTALCADYRVNVQISYGVEARAPIGRVTTGFDRQILVQQELSRFTKEWSATCQAPTPSSNQRATSGLSAR